MSAITFRCPFCGALTRSTGTEVAHQTPMCASFEDYSPDKYLMLVNDEIARQRGYRVDRSGGDVRFVKESEENK